MDMYDGRCVRSNVGRVLAYVNSLIDTRAMQATSISCCVNM